MPDNNEITLKDLFERIVKIEEKLDHLVSVASGGIIKEEQQQENASPFFNPDTGLYDIKYYRKNQDEGERK
jgi:hypothetical protein